MPTTMPVALARRRRSHRMDPFVIMLVVLYAACAIAMVDAVIRGAAPVFDGIAPGL